MSARPAQTAVIYARQSFDRRGDELAVTRQLRLCREFCHERGWEVVAEQVDNDRSATTGVARPGFEALLASKPERIVTWHVDRLVRLTRDLERVIELGVNVHALKAGHLDLSNPAGRAVARTVTAWATYEVEQKVLRQRAANDQRAADGLPYRCQRAFGYEPDGMSIRELEAVELRKAADGVLRGRSLSAMAADLNERGVVTSAGKPWRATTLKAALLSPRNAGLRRHRGEVVGEAAWPAILDVETASSVRAILTDESRTQRGPSRRYLLSGAMSCGKCGLPVVGAFVKGKGTTYRCPTIHLSRQAEPLDLAVTALVVERLARADAVDLFAEPGRGDRLAELLSEQSGARARLDALAEAFAVGDIDRQALAAGSKRLRDRLDALTTEMSSAVEDPTLRELVTADDVAAAFDALPIETKRSVIGELLSIELRPVGPGRRNVNPAESITWVWRR